MNWRYRSPLGWLTVVLPIAIAFSAGLAPAQQGGWIRVVVTGQDGEGSNAATVRLTGSTLGALTNTAGVVTLGPIAPGSYEVIASRIGQHEMREAVDVSAGDTAVVRLTLMDRPVVLGGIQVSMLRPDLRPEVELVEEEVRAANAHDMGAVLRTAPGLDAVRRGALGLDPVVRGLRDTQVGAYVDGMRTLPGGPAGMDSPLSHVDPSAVHSMEIIKGPYALTWGAGNMSAIRVETHPLPAADAAALSGTAFAGYDANLAASEAGLTLSGAQRRVTYTASGSWRQGGDYTSGAGAIVESDFDSGELRARIGFATTPTSLLTLTGSYQKQGEIDYPGRPLDADWFDTLNGSLRWQNRPASGRVRSVDLQGYFYGVDHGMDNDDKPTALPNPDRMPPFPLDILTVAGVDMFGGRATAELQAGDDWTLEIGGDVYTADHNSHRTTSRRDTGAAMPTGLIWGGARVTDAGIFTRALHQIGAVAASGTVRLDLVDARTDSTSAFFLENVSSDLTAREANISGAFTMTLPLGSHLAFSAGAGSVVRTAEANERYSDRAPAKKAQIGAEFVGNPQIRPERSTQVDLWLEAGYPRVAASVNLFARRLDDHITLEETDLPRQSAMSAPQVFRYVNGTANYLGGEATLVTELPGSLTLSTSAAYLRGHDTTLDEPALGVTPLRGELSIRWQPPTAGNYVEGAIHAVDRQDRVSTTRGEWVTPGYATADLEAGVELPFGVLLRGGVKNLLDRGYVNHLNARNPFTSIPIAEPGRVFYTRISARF